MELFSNADVWISGGQAILQYKPGAYLKKLSLLKILKYCNITEVDSMISRWWKFETMVKKQSIASTILKNLILYIHHCCFDSSLSVFCYFAFLLLLYRLFNIFFHHHVFVLFLHRPIVFSPPLYRVFTSFLLTLLNTMLISRNHGETPWCKHK